MIRDVPHYIPPFIWKLWSSSLGRNSAGSTATRLHGYDVYSDTLFDACEEEGFVERLVFHDIQHLEKLLPRVRLVLNEAEDAFNRLQDEAEQVMHDIIRLVYNKSSTTVLKISVERARFATLAKFLAFVRFRNSSKYSDIVNSIKQGHEPFRRSPSDDHDAPPRSRQIISIYHDFIQQIRCEFLLKAFIRFFRASIDEIHFGMSVMVNIPSNTILEPFNTPPEAHSQVRADPWLEAFSIHCWRFCREAEFFLGVASEEDGQEFILPDTCFVSVDESMISGVDQEDESDCEPANVLFPILPTLALYVLRGEEMQNSADPRTVIDVGQELYSDIHLRNAMVLSTVPYSHNHMRRPFVSFDRSSPPEELKPCLISPSDVQYSSPTSCGIEDKSTATVRGPRIYFCSLSSIARSISSYDLSRARWEADRFVDYGHLKKKCRQRFLMERVTKMLSVKGDLMVTDLTEEVQIIGKDPVACGAFSDVWTGKWYDRMERKEQRVAIKYLRQVMVQNVREKLLKRLQEEIHVWHQLCHSNLATLYGLVQTSTSIGMVSLWCDNGTVCRYIKEHPQADKLALLIQITSGISYLHHFVPPVVHGDLKAGNILIDAEGQAIITDFGLSKVMEDLSTSMTDSGQAVPTSFFAGSTRWMAPELVEGLIQDEANTKLPQVTTYSDVYAFASVCLEIITGQLPYPHRSNDYQVTVDIMGGVKPSRGASAINCQALGIKDSRTTPEGEDVLFAFLDQCWDPVRYLRPKMEDAVGFFSALNTAG
ncbi:hypothetical protein V5O48_008081 [Marasmius crinis-equi]|uniref:Protein kinase domain-containing protein n=1 Tax=Marasmius crinis-equi TaxID=585013 RepID=A0ABR3FF30_9AGAR